MRVWQAILRVLRFEIWRPLSKRQSRFLFGLALLAAVYVISYLPLREAGIIVCDRYLVMINSRPIEYRVRNDFRARESFWAQVLLLFYRPVMAVETFLRDYSTIDCNFRYDRDTVSRWQGEQSGY